MSSDTEAPIGMNSAWLTSMVCIPAEEHFQQMQCSFEKNVTKRFKDVSDKKSLPVKLSRFIILIKLNAGCGILI